MVGGHMFQVERQGTKGFFCCFQVIQCPGRGLASSRCQLWGGCCTWDRPSQPRRERTPVSAATWQEITARTSGWRCMVSGAGLT